MVCSRQCKLTAVPLVALEGEAFHALLDNAPGLGRCFSGEYLDRSLAPKVLTSGKRGRPALEPVQRLVIPRKPRAGWGETLPWFLQPMPGAPEPEPEPEPVLPEPVLEPVASSSTEQSDGHNSGEGSLPTWVQCDKCQKWRVLPSNAEPINEDAAWYCSLNPDSQFNSCDIEEEEWEEE